MHRIATLLAIVAVVSACSAGTAGPAEPANQTSTSSSTSSSPASTTTTSASTTTSTVPQGPPVGWIAPSGVTLAVTSFDAESVEVLTPCANPAVLSRGTPIYNVDVVIDPGHGGPVDTGAIGFTGLAEKEINLRVGLAVNELLAERGIAAVMTRTGDYPIPIRTRVEYAHLMGASLLVSLHHNAPAAPASEIPGVEVFVQDDSAESQRLGGLLYDEAMSALGEFDVDWDRADDAGVMTVLNSEGSDAYGMVRLPEIPSALIELGYIANPAEAELYGNPKYVEVAANAVADAIDSFLNSDESGAPMVEGRVFNPNRGVGRDQCVEPDLELPLYPDVVDVSVSGGNDGYTFQVTVSSPYDSVDRYADAWRVVGDDGVVYGVRELTHDHATEQPFTRTLGGVDIPSEVATVTIEARDQLYGWGGDSLTVVLP